jgi:hypothetical protein
MRIVLGTLTVLLASSALQTAAGQEYPWCAIYDMEGSVTNCGFVSREQCSWTVSGVGGYCAPNPFYAAAVASPRQPRKHRRSRP